MSYNVLQRTTFLYELVKNNKVPVILELLNTLEMNAKKDCPFLFPEVF